MAETLTASIKLILTAALAGNTDLGVNEYNLPFSRTLAFANGDALDKANQIWSDTITIAASTTLDIDLAGGVINALGSTLTFTKIKAIMVSARTANTNNVVIGGDSNGLVNWVGAANDLVNVRPGGLFLIAAPDLTGYAVTAGTGDVLQIANSGAGTSVVFDLVVIGVA